MANFARSNLPTLKKTASYYLVHITVAALVAYAVTGDLFMAFTLKPAGADGAGRGLLPAREGMGRRSPPEAARPRAHG